MFKPIAPPTRAAEKVVEQIQQYIESGKLEPNDCLPAERKLAAQFGVSRATIREAIRILSSWGLVEVRHGLGTFVTSQLPSSDQGGVWFPVLQAHRVDLLHLLEVRSALEIKGAYLAAIRRSEEQLEQAARLVEQMWEAVDPVDGQRLADLDRTFHTLVAAMTGNPMLVRLTDRMGLAFSDRRATFAIPGRARASCAEHEAIVAALRQGDPERAAAAMEAHLTALVRAVKELGSVSSSNAGVGGKFHPS